MAEPVCVTGFEDGGGGHEARNIRNAGAPGSRKREGNRFSPELLEGAQPCPHLDISSARPCSTSDLQDRKIINVSCLKPPVVICHGSKNTKAAPSLKQLTFLSLKCRKYLLCGLPAV